MRELDFLKSILLRNLLPPSLFILNAMLNFNRPDSHMMEGGIK